VIPEEDEAPREPPPRQGEFDVLAERRARRAWLGSPALARRAEAAEATVHTLETHLADLRRRQAEAEHELEMAAAQLLERERELRRVKQREHAEQQLRVEAEEAAVRLRRGHRGELDRLQRRAEEAHAAAQHAEEQRAALAARLAGVSGICARLERSVVALQGVAVELRTKFERDHLAAQARIAELERKLAQSPTKGSEAKDPVHREEMAGALAAAVERLRARAVPASEDEAPIVQAPEAQAPKAQAPEAREAQAPPERQAREAQAGEAPAPAAPAPPREIPTVIVVPRLFPASRRRAPRLAPVVRRIAARLAEWADRDEDLPR
jgi:hypothetical protein